jgi:glutamine amidotransferase
MSSVTGIINYGAGNIRSIENAVYELGSQVELVSTADQLGVCTHLILPGVGSFGFCADKFRSSDLLAAVENWALVDEKPLLGICVGMQLLYSSSEESPTAKGLDWLGGTVNQMQPHPPTTRVPHVGWNTVSFTSDFGSFKAGSAADFYFDHSFSCASPAKGDVIGICNHGDNFVAVAAHKNIVAAQFHPEKSQEAGLAFLKAFLS